MTNVKPGKPILNYGGRVFSKYQKHSYDDYKPNSWFFIQTLKNLSTANVEAMKIHHNIDLNPLTMISSGWFKYFLDEKQFSYLKSSDDFELYQLQPFNFINKTDFHSNKYIIHATENWSPRFSAKYQHLGNNFYSVSNTNSIEEALSDSRIFSIHNFPKRISLNRYAGGFLQSGENALHYLTTYRVLETIGITGKGQIINVVDSGVDRMHCLFYDPDHEVPVNKTDFSHRKIVRIDDWKDSLDHSDGHGTHVCGISLGNAYKQKSGMSLYNGVAPDAKLFMTDLGDAAIRDDVSADYDLSLTSQRQLEMGSYISSNSWGFFPNIHIITVLHDYEAYNNPNITFVFAAGNRGRDLTINSAGDSKLVLTVGNAVSPSIYTVEDSRSIVMVNENGDKVQLSENFGSRYWDLQRSEDSLQIIDKNIVQYEAGKQYNDNIVLISCSDLEKLEQNSTNGILAFITSQSCNNNFAKIASFNAKDSFKTISGFKKGTIFFEQVNYNSPRIGGSSSRGPTRRNILKPDVVAPGQPILSAKAGSPKRTSPGSCSASEIISKQGTSMAAPTISGLSALIMNYMEEKFGVKPITSYLLRALVINSCEPFDSSKNEPDTTSGFGIPRLTNTFPVNDDKKNLLFMDRLIIDQDQQYKFTFSVKQRGYRLCITMSYLDPPADAFEEEEKDNFPLFADLDLVVITPSGNLILGNQYESFKPEHFSTNERVLLDKAEAGQYTCYVKSAKEFPIKTGIAYAIAVSGNVNNDLKMELTNECIGTRCKCSSESFGYNCNEDIIVLSGKAEVDVTIKARDYKVYKLNVQNVTEKSPFKISLISKSSADNLMMCFSINEFKGIGSSMDCHKFATADSFTFDQELYPEIKNGTKIYMALYMISASSAKIKFSTDPLKVIWWTSLAFRLACGIAVGVIFTVLVVILIIKSIRYSRMNKDVLEDNTEIVNNTEVAI